MSIGRISEFKVQSDDWNLYVERLENYFLVNDIKSELRVATLITVMGAESYELLVNLCTPHKPNTKTFEQLTAIVEKHLKPKPSILAERYKFRQRKQKEGETIADYLAALKKLSKTCELGVWLEESIRDQFVCGISSEVIRQRLFAEDKLDYAKAYSMAVSMEAAEKNAAAVVGHSRVTEKTDTAVECLAVTSTRQNTATAAGRRAVVVRGENQPVAQSEQRRAGWRGSRVAKVASPAPAPAERVRQQQQCSACGKSHDTAWCKFTRYVCRVCNKQGHLQRMCPLGVEHHHVRDVEILSDGEDSDEPHVAFTQQVLIDGHPRRIRVPDKPNYPLSLWSIMKNCIGKELSKIPIPVNFSEPLSMLQRLTEDYEYSSVLDQAAKFSDPAQQLAYVAAFTVSSYATTACRTNKPFNPLLGETFECDRMSDLGWRSISEQVSHHPPMVAQFCEGQAGWQCWQEFTMTTKFRGKYLQVIPLGGASAMFPSSGNKYTWRKVTTTVHNIIVGKLWVDNHGDMDIVGEAGQAAGYVAHLKYLPYGYFSKDTQRKVTGVIKDPQGVPRYVLQGHWDDRVEVAPVTSASPDNTVCKTGKFTVAWERVAAPPDSDKWYNFTLLAAQLNEFEEGVAPSDSRRRPDQRLMEEGLWDDANAEKLRLEEKQRAKRRELEAAAELAAARAAPAPPAPAPRWFSRQALSAHAAQPTPHLRHLYTHRYWESKRKQDWGDCPDIF